MLNWNLSLYSYSLVKYTQYSETPLIRSPMGQKKFGRINDGFFYKKMYGGFCKAARKRRRDNEVAVRRGFTVLSKLAALNCNGKRVIELSSKE